MYLLVRRADRIVWLLGDLVILGGGKGTTGMQQSETTRESRRCPVKRHGHEGNEPRNGRRRERERGRRATEGRRPNGFLGLSFIPSDLIG